VLEQAAIPYTRFLNAEATQRLHGADTGGARREILGTLVVERADAVPHVLALANARGLTLWPFSGGRNFGYGTTLPVAQGSLLVDLSQLKQIDYFEDSQTFRLEAGVTQQDLADFLDRHRLDYLVPTTGVGPNGTLIGNALDGGYGLTPIADHFDALTDIEGHWGNGQAFHAGLRDLGCADMARRWPAGLGPSLHGVLRQGNFGIVTRATLRLARRPEASRVLIVEWPSDAAFFAAQAELSRLTEELPLLGGIIAMNGARVLSTQGDAPLTSALRGTDRQRHFEALCRAREIAAWTGVGTLYGPRHTLAGAVRDLRRRLPGARVWSFTPTQIRRLQRVAARLPASWFPATRRRLASLVSMLGTVEGRPIVAFLRIAYALDSSRPVMDLSRHPARDGRGILWFAPLVPLTEAGVRCYAELMARTLALHGFDPLLAVTTRSSRVHCGTIPLLFDKTDADIARARACYRELVAVGLSMGMPPYRIGADFMDMVFPPADSAGAALWRGLKAQLDPNGVIAPGRYVASV
jgi:4-cresol dehydrogenase (hydroxylating) flavoprotein subunit